MQAELQALNRGVVECYGSRDKCLELFQTVAAAVEVVKPPFEQTSEAHAQSALRGSSKRHKAKNSGKAKKKKPCKGLKPNMQTPAQRVLRDEPRAKACKRKCFKCRQCGHIARDCTQAIVAES